MLLSGYFSKVKGLLLSSAILDLVYARRSKPVAERVVYKSHYTLNDNYN